MVEYLPVLIMFTVAVGMACVIPVLSWFLGPKKPTRSKLSVYECGLRPVGNARERFSVKFYLVAILFIVFDIEIVFMYPWAISFREALALQKSGEVAGLGWFWMIEMLIFFMVLTLGLVYAWRKGALDWNVSKGGHHVA